MKNKSTPNLLEAYGFIKYKHFWYYRKDNYLFEYWSNIEVLYIREVRESQYNIRIEYMTYKRLITIIESITNTEDSSFANN